MERKSDTKRIGALGEKHVASLLKKQGCRILGRNVHLSHKEIDIVAESATHILFVEVKTRSTDKVNLYRPADAVNGAKQRNLLAAAAMYLRSQLNEEQAAKQPRIDVAEVYLHEGKVERVNYIPNAVTR
ncbi:MAG: YraN family protein [Clostridia bacterium]|nr:YraN family protein [Clostridia bacterium]